MRNGLSCLRVATFGDSRYQIALMYCVVQGGDESSASPRGYSGVSSFTLFSSCSCRHCITTSIVPTVVLGSEVRAAAPELYLIPRYRILREKRVQSTKKLGPSFAARAESYIQRHANVSQSLSIHFNSSTTPLPTSATLILRQQLAKHQGSKGNPVLP